VKERKKFVEKIKEQLAERRAEMTSMLTLSSHEQVSDGQIQDSGDEALSITMEQLKNSLEQTEIDELRLIDDALKRIIKGEYGYCIDCEEVISERRLAHSAYAARCIVCQEEFES
jgi:DnaK suppressor protein